MKREFMPDVPGLKHKLDTPSTGPAYEGKVPPIRHNSGNAAKSSNPSGGAVDPKQYERK